MSRKRKVSDEEARLLDYAMKNVRPLKRGAKAATKPVAPVRKAAKLQTDSALPRSASAKQEGSKAKSASRITPTKTSTPVQSIDRRTEQKLKRGRMEIEATLDLHGLTQHAAHARLMRFVARSCEGGLKAVLVITGKGARGTDEGGIMAGERRGVLKAQVPLWLAEAPMRDYVSGVRAAGPRHGGAGALYVLLKRRK